LAKNSSFGFFSVGLCFGKKPNVLFVRLAFFVQMLMFSTIFRIMYNVVVYGKLRFCVRGFSAGKSDVTKLQLSLVKN
jgi:hypothetical protein